jgi:hypothetical protein
MIGRPCCTFGPGTFPLDMPQFMFDETMLLFDPLEKLYRMLNMLNQGDPTPYQSNGFGAFSFVRLQSPDNLGKQNDQRNH